MRFKAVSVVLGALVASSFSTPTRLGPGGMADAADAIPPTQQRPQAIKVPEFVPVVNFSEFVLAMQAFAAQNPPAARIAAEALSAKFALNGDAKLADAQQIEVRKPDQQVAGAAPEKSAPVIVTRPVVTASISEAPAEPEVPGVPDPNRRQSAVADPVKIITGYPAKTAETTAKRHKAERKVASAGHERLAKKFQPAMGLGMMIDSAEEAPPMSSLAQKKSKVSTGSRGIE